MSAAWVVAVLIVSAVTGCSALTRPNASMRPQPPSTLSKTAAAGDYAALLIKPNAISTPGDTYTAQRPTLNPDGLPGAATVFVNQAGTRALGNTIFVLPTADAATRSLNGAKQALGTVIRDADARPAAVGANGTTATGMSPDGSKAVTVVMFTEGRTFATLKFDAAPTDAVASPQATQAAQRQDALIKNTPV
jgi:hypothetical protein